MTKDLGRISKLKDAIDTLTIISSAIDVIVEETGIEWVDSPDKAIKVAKELLKELKKTK